ncbi:MAG TPA: right-handed parallel beta-helix repeat-containing protein [Thermoanaerobaculia bacterium]
MRKGSLSILIAIIALLVSTPAFGQLVPRTWVSGVGDDANSCSRTAPCRTFAGAIAKTAANGEILALDPGSYGPVTIAKSISIDGQAQQASISAPGATGITINGAGIVVNLRNLSINGEFTTAGSGIRIVNAAAVNISNCTIMNFTGTGSVGRGVSIETGVADVRVTVDDSVIYNNGHHGIASAPTAGNVALNVHNCRIYKGGNSAVSLRNLTKATISYCNLSNHSIGAGVVLEQTTAEAMVSNTVISNNAFGIFSGVAAGTPTTRLYACTITGNTVVGLQINNGGSVFTHGNNAIRGNAGNETPTGASLGTQ